MSLSDVAQATGLARPTARRLLLTLEELGFVRSRDGRVHPDPAGARPRARRTSRRSGSGRSPGRGSRSLVGRTGESSSMAQLDGSDIVYVARVSVPKIIALRVEVGTRFPAPPTSQGKVLLAALDPASLDAVLATAQPLRSRAARRADRWRSWRTSSRGCGPAAGRSPTRSSRPGCGRSRCPCATGPARCARR